MTTQVDGAFGAGFGRGFARYALRADAVVALGPPLAPPSASALEAELARLSAYLDLVDPSVITTIWDAWRAPAALLPWLAWAMSVDVWDEAWPEVRRRQAIADAPAYHRFKGTWAAVERMLALAERPYSITEWFEASPRGRRGTAHVHIEAEVDEVADIVARITPLVMTAKAKSRAIGVGAGPALRGAIVLAAGLLCEEMIVVPPYAYAGETVTGTLVAAVATLVEETIIVRPI